MEIEKKILELLDEKEEAIVEKATVSVLGKPMHDITSSLTSMMDNSDVYSCGAKEYFDKKHFLSFLEILELWNKKEKAVADKAKVSVLGKPMHDITSSLTSMVDNSDVYSCAVKEYFDTKPFLSFLKVDNSPLVPWNRGPTSATAKVNDDTTSTPSLIANLSNDDTTSTSSLSANLSNDDTTSTSSLSTDDDDDSSSNEGQQFMQFQPGSFFSYDLFEIR